MPKVSLFFVHRFAPLFMLYTCSPHQPFMFVFLAVLMKQNLLFIIYFINITKIYQVLIVLRNENDIEFSVCGSK